MATERKIIRDAIVAAIKADFVAPIYCSRAVDGREDDNFVNVYFDSGDIEFDGLLTKTRATIVVSYHDRNAQSDDDIDASADFLNNILATADIAPDVIQGMVPAGFEYADERESSFSGIYLRYTIIY